MELIYDLMISANLFVWLYDFNIEFEQKKSDMIHYPILY